jgi:hypothetical protein
MVLRNSPAHVVSQRKGLLSHILIPPQLYFEVIVCVDDGLVEFGSDWADCVLTEPNLMDRLFDDQRRESLKCRIL